MSSALVLVSGSRRIGPTSPAANAIRARLMRYRTDFSRVVVFHGGAEGADNVADVWARSNANSLIVLPALWERFGKAAGGKRNDELLQALLAAYENDRQRHLVPTAFVDCFPCPESCGTWDMYYKAQRYTLPAVFEVGIPGREL